MTNATMRFYPLILLAVWLALPTAGWGAFGLSTNTDYYTVDTGAGLVFKVRRVEEAGVNPNTVSVGDIRSLVYNGVEYQDQARGSQINSGFDWLGYSNSIVSVSAEMVNTDYIKVTVTTADLIHYYIARKGYPHIYMATYFDVEPVTTGGLCRYIVRMPYSKLPNGPPPSDLTGTTYTVESADIFGLPNGETRSKHYSNQRLLDWFYTGATGNGVGVFMMRGSSEGSSGGPFYRCLINQGGGDQEVYEMINYGEGQTEAFRTGILDGPYALVFTDGTPPAAPLDYSWLETAGLNLTHWIPASGRGVVKGTATGVPTGFQAVVGFANTNAQYWAIATNGNYITPLMIPGTYAVTLYKQELAVATSSVTVNVGATNTLNLVSTEANPAFIFKLGDWDGTPAGFLNAKNIQTMHPSDVRNASWTNTDFTVETNPAAYFPAIQTRQANGTLTLRFNLTSAQAAASHTVRIGITTAYIGGRPKITVNSWSSANPSAPSEPGTRTFTVGTYRANNWLYTYSVPASAFVVGQNILQMSPISGSADSTTWLSAGYVFDCVQLDGVPLAPPAPTNVVASLNGAQVGLSWTPVFNAVSYTIRRANVSGGSYTIIASGVPVSAFTDTILTNGDVYYYVITAVNSSGESAFSAEVNSAGLLAASGTWIADASGNWNSPDNWSGNAIAEGSGNLADFSTLNLTADRTVTLDGAHTISTLNFADTTPDFNWTLAGSRTLNLGAPAIINIVNQTTTISAPVAGVSGLTKTGVGTLKLGGATNTFSGGILLNSGTTLLDFSASGSPDVNLLPPGNTLTLGGANGGGRLILTGKNSTANAQTNAGLAFGAGANRMTLTPGVSGAMDLTITNPVTIPPNLVHGTLQFSSSGTTTLPGNLSVTKFVNALGGLYATFGPDDFAATDGNGVVLAAAYANAATGFSGVNTDINNVTGNFTWSSGNDPVAIRFADATGRTVTLNDPSFFTTAILVASTSGTAAIIGSGSIRDYGNSGQPDGDFNLIQQSPNDFTLGVPINDNNVASGRNDALVKSGSGKVILTAANGYSLGTYINQGTVQVGNGGTTGALGTGGVVNYGTLIYNRSDSITEANVISGSGSLSQNGSGITTLTGFNSFTGDLNVNAGVLGVSANNNNNNPTTGPLGNTSVARNLTVNNGGTLKFILGNALGSTLTAVAATLVINSGGIVTNAANDIETLGPIQLNGGTLTGGGGAYSAFQMYDLRGTVTVGGSSASTISGPDNGSSGYHLAAPTDFNVADATGDANADLYCSGVLVDQDGAGTAFGHLGAPGSLVKTGAGTMVLSGANAYTGETIVNDGTLLVNGDSSAATGAVTVSFGATLGGHGILGGATEVQSGGTLSPGASIGALTFNNSLTLDAGSESIFEISKSPATNDVVNIFGVLINGGTLMVTNISASPLAAGDSFQLFNAGSYQGAFASVILPGLSAGLAWDTSALNTSGRLTVASLAPPQFGGIHLNGGAVVLAATNGTPSASCVVLGSTNLTLAPADWTPLATNVFDGNGNFSYTNAINANAPQMFYRLVSP